ncbi:MAG: DUF1992 domain-containing protein [Rubrivivax sp.]
MSPEEQKRENRLKLLDDHIGQSLRESEASGELKAAPSYGKPLHFGDGYDETPDALKMPMKILKDAGCAPPEVALMREIAALQAQLDGAAGLDETTLKPQRQRLAEMRQQLALRLEKLRATGSF